jgi:putative oxidoreductase
VSAPRSANPNLIALGLRIGLGALFVAHGWPKLSDLAGNIALWQHLHLPLPAVLGPVQAVVEFLGGILLLCGLLTRAVGFLLAVDALGAILVVDVHTGMIIGLEWLALWVSLALLASGAGAWSLDEFLRNRR